ncbi:hypothetical protein B0H12DRAFT_1101364 [Mycena haematopus]|nr:hypothetical protein B0H12DRAFT_1101364 [Mycena haematopus]
MFCLASGSRSHPFVLTTALTRFEHWPKTSRTQLGMSVRRVRSTSWAQGIRMGSAYEERSEMCNLRSRGTLVNDGGAVRPTYSMGIPRLSSSRLSSLAPASRLIKEGGEE